MGKLNLDQTKINKSREYARQASKKIIEEARIHTTVTQERTVVRFFGIDGVNEEGIPLANLIVNQLKNRSKLDEGVAKYILNAVYYYDLTPQEIAEKLALSEINLIDIPMADFEEIRQLSVSYVDKALTKIKANCELRKEIIANNPMGKTPYQYVIVATGNIYEDLTQAKAAAYQGADIVAVIRSTGQSLLDYVPYGATKEGFGGTYASQENFRIMREGLDQVSKELGRYIYLVNYCSGLCMPEIAIMGAFERVDMMLNDSMYGILFRDINMKRTFIDQYFSRMINAYADVIINTGEDNYLTTADAYQEGHTVLASQFINEQMGLFSGLDNEQLGLGHAFEIDPNLENSLLYEIAKAQLSRDIFPKAPLKYMPPTKHMTGDIFKGHILDSLFNLTSVMTGQDIHLLGMPTEAIHTPLMQDRALALDSSLYIKNAARDLMNELSYKNDGIINNYAQKILDDALVILKQIAVEGLENSLAKGMFADIKRAVNGGKGLEGVIRRSDSYFNPFIDALEEKLGIGDVKDE